MNWYTVAWVAWAAAFAVIETVALVRRDSTGKPRTLSAHVWWLVRGNSPAHAVARVALAVGLAWLGRHLLGA